jgi:hypothetical protein
MSIPFTWIYLIYDPHTKLFKVGKSDDPRMRLKQLCKPSTYGTVPAAPTEYTLIEAWFAPENAEKVVHEDYKKFRVRGEWFDFSSWATDSDEPLEMLVREWFDTEYFRSNERLIADGSRLSDDYYNLLDEHESLYARLYPDGYPTENSPIEPITEVIH